MKISLGNGLSFLAISTLLVGCQATDLSEEKNLENETSQEATDKRVEKSEHGHNHSHVEKKIRFTPVILKIVKYSIVLFRIGMVTGNPSIHTSRMAHLMKYLHIRQSMKARSLLKTIRNTTELDIKQMLIVL